MLAELPFNAIAQQFEGQPVTMKINVGYIFEVEKHLTRWFEVSANKKAEKYFKKKGVAWDYTKYPINIDRIINYYKKDK